MLASFNNHQIHLDPMMCHWVLAKMMASHRHNRRDSIASSKQLRDDIVVQFL